MMPVGAMNDIGASTLTPRQEQLLRAVCRDYILTGREVSSGGVVRSHGLRWSSATVRQELAALERIGYLQRAHHSSGRLPTRLGLERYIALLPKAGEPPPAVAQAVDLSLREGQSPDHGLRAAACVLSEVAGCVAISFVGSTRGGRIREVDVAPLVGPRALVVVTMDSGKTVVHPVSLEQEFAAGDDGTAPMLALQERLRWLCRGRTLMQARSRLLELQRDQEARIDRILRASLRVGLLVCAGLGLDPLWLQVAGQPTLARELGSPQRLGDVLELLEDVQRLADVLCQLLPEPSDDGPVRAEVRVRADALFDAQQAGATMQSGGRSVEVGELELGGLTLIGCRLPRAVQGGESETTRGAVAILGSDRMDYVSVIPLVEYAARALAARTCALA